MDPGILQTFLGCLEQSVPLRSHLVAVLHPDDVGGRIVLVIHGDCNFWQKWKKHTIECIDFYKINRVPNLVPFRVTSSLELYDAGLPLAKHSISFFQHIGLLLIVSSERVWVVRVGTELRKILAPAECRNLLFYSYSLEILSSKSTILDRFAFKP